MESGILSDIVIKSGQSNLTDNQRKQFRQLLTEGFSSKMMKIMGQDFEVMSKVMDVWVKYGFMPTDETFCAVDGNTGDVLSIVMLNNFKDPNLFKTLACTAKTAGIIGISKTLKGASPILRLGKYNSMMDSPNIVAEIFLAYTRKDMQGHGIGKLLLEYVLEYAHSKCKCGVKDACKCKVKLLVFSRNPARRLYESLGFKEVKCVATPEMEKGFGQDFDSLVWMERPLFT